MWDPHTETLIFALFALMIGVVVFGGTTLGYFLENRASRSHAPERTSKTD
jgi:hypothetical protein